MSNTPSYLTDNRVAICRPAMPAQSVVVTNDLATTPNFKFDRGSQIAIRRTSGSVTELTPHSADIPQGTYTRIRIDGNLIAITVDADWTVVDPNIFPFENLRFVGNLAGTIQIIQKG